MTETEATALVEWLAAAGGAVRPRGIHLHVGSQLGAVDAWRDAVRRGLAVVGLLRGGCRTSTRSTSGAASRSCRSTSRRRARAVRPRDARPARGVPEDRRPRRLAIEPGRFLVARAGWLVGARPPRPRAGRAAGRPRHRDDRAHPAGPVRRPASDRGADLARPGRRRPAAGAAPATEPTRVQGPICESTDALGDHALPPLRRGDLVAIRDAGAYARLAGSTYNGRPHATAGPARARRQAPARPRAAVAGARVRMMPMHRARRPLALVAALAWLLVVAGGQVAAASPSPRRRPARPSPSPDGDQASTTRRALPRGRDRKAEATIDAIEARTGAEVVVYTQDSGEDPTTDETEAKARALMDQWGVGRKGFDDGLVILFDMYPNHEHGQVQLYAGPGFRAAYLVNEKHQAIFEDDMLPLLRGGDLDGALAVALTKVDAAATPEHAADARAGAPDQRGRRPGRRPDRLPRPVGLGALPLAAVRPGPGLPRRPVDADAGATARPDRRVRGDGPGRVHVAPGPDHGDARPRVPRPDRVPRGRGGLLGHRRHKVGVESARPRATRRSRRSAGSTPAAARPGRGARAHASRDARCRRGWGRTSARRPARSSARR